MSYLILSAKKKLISLFSLITIHNKKNGHSACNLSKIKGCRAFIKLDKLISNFIFI